MKVLVEFYGIPRVRAGQASLELTWDSDETAVTLGEVLGELADQLPEFAQHCLEDNCLKAGYIANLNGRQFVTDPVTPIADGESLLLLSADAGG